MGDALRTLMEQEYARLDREVYAGALPSFPGVRLTRGVHRLGSCRSVRRDRGHALTGFTLSRRLLDATAARRLDVVRHEVAHAAAIVLDGHAGHGAPWRRHAKLCGAQPRRCHDGSGLPTLTREDYPIVVACTSCTTWRGYLRKGKVAARPGRYRCGRCGGRLTRTK